MPATAGYASFDLSYVRSVEVRQTDGHAFIASFAGGHLVHQLTVWSQIPSCMKNRMGPVDLTAVGSAGRLQEKFAAVVVGVLSETRIWVDFFTSMNFPVWG